MNRYQPLGTLRDGAFSHLVEKACRHWEGRQAAAARLDVPPQKAHGLTVALSRQPGTDGARVAAEVGAMLGWHVYDQELLERIAEDMGLRTALLESVDERRQGWLRESFQADLAALVTGGSGPRASQADYVRHMVKTIRALGAHGECVIVGRGAAFILPPETTLRVRLVGPEKQRAAVLGRNLGLGEREAAARLRTMDCERKAFLRKHLAKDPSDPALYDLVLNTERLPVRKMAEMIVEGLRRV
jgi:cytidylate kinase